MTAGVGAGVYHVATPSFVSLPRKTSEPHPHLYNGPEIYAQRQPPRHDPRIRLSVHTPTVHLAKTAYSSVVIGLVTS